MGLHKSVDAMCDQCWGHYNSPEVTVALLWEKLKDEGWSRRGRQTICPDCNGRQRRDYPESDETYWDSRIGL